MTEHDVHQNTQQVEQAAKNIFRIPVALPGNPLKELNSYLITDAERCLLVDTGFRLEACRDALLDGLRQLGIAPDSVDIFLTHLHADHSGLAPEIIGPGRRIYISETDGRMLSRIPPKNDNAPGEHANRWSRIKERDILAGMPPEIVNNIEAISPAIANAPPGGAEYTMLKNGDSLRAGGYTLRCILTPGHTPGHMCLWDETHGLMFTGDHVLFDITPNITAWPEVDDSLGDYLDSLRYIRGYPVKTPLPGHRKPGDFHERIDELFKHHSTRLAEVENIVRTCPGLTAYDIAGRMNWKIRAKNWNEFPAAQKIFAVGECLSHLDYLLKRGIIKRETRENAHLYLLV